MINAIDNPVAPSQIPPVLINFMSPSPIGGMSVLWCSWFRLMRSYANPIIADIPNPNAAPIAASRVDIIHGNQAVMTKPMISNGNRYMSGIILRRLSAIVMRMVQNIANNSKTIKKML